MYDSGLSEIEPYIKLYSRDEFPLLLDYLGLTGIGVEIGVEKGEFSNIILENSHLSILYSIDSWIELSKEDYQDINNLTNDEHLKNKRLTEQLLKHHDKRSQILQCFSKDAVKRFKDNELDFVYLDANHRYEHVKEDIELWYLKLKIGGIFAGHDYFTDGLYTTGILEVKSAVDEFVKRETQELFVINEGYNSWYIIKRKN